VPKKQPIEIPYPFLGIDENWAYRGQPKGTTPDALNARPYDSIDNRLRGGQRDGLSKYLDDAVNGTYFIQAITQATTVSSDLIIADASLGFETFTYADGWLGTEASAVWDTYEETGIGAGGHGSNAVPFDTDDIPSTTYPVVGDNKLDGVQGIAHLISAAIHKTVIAPGTNYVIRCKFKLNAADYGDGNHSRPRVQILFRVVTDRSSGLGGQAYGCLSVEKYENEKHYIVLRAGAETASSLQLTVTNGYTDAWWLLEHTLELRVAGDTMWGFIDGKLLVGPHTSTNNNTQTNWGICLGDGSATGTTIYIDDVRISEGVVPPTLRAVHLVVVSGGDIFSGDRNEGLAIATSGDDVLSATRKPIGVQEAFNKCYFCDGLGADYTILEPVANTASSWEATAGALPAGGTGTTYAITAVDTAAKTFTVAEDLSALSDGDYIEVRGSTGNDGSYTVASDAGSGPTVITVDNTIPDATVDGNILVALKGCRIITLYRGRIVMAGLESDPHNWFMSASGDPLDWDYFPATDSQTMAVAGNIADTGKLGDVITALAPYSDDLLIIGCDHTLWVMRGDPAAGGVIDNVSYQTGIAGQEAFTWDTDGNFYFFGAGTLWRMAAGVVSTPEPLSRNKLDNTFGAINYGTHEIRLLWDNAHKGIHLYFTPVNQPAASPSHYFWDLRTNSFWRDEYPVAYGPTAVHVFDADDPGDRAALIGGFDSYIRFLDDDSSDDDGTVIASYVYFTPIMAAGNLANFRLIEITPILSADSDPVTLKVYAGKTAEQAIESTTPRFTRELQAGRNPSIRNRVNGNAMICRLENSSSTARTWAFESMTGIIEPSGKTRHGGL